MILDFWNSAPKIFYKSKLVKLPQFHENLNSQKSSN